MATMKSTVTRPGKSSNGSQAATGDLDPHEWDFKNVYNDEKEACYLYEAAREFYNTSQHLQKLKCKWAASLKRKSVAGSLAWNQALDLLRKNFSNFPDVGFKYFPEIAWRKLPDRERRQAADSVNEWTARHKKNHADRLHMETLRQCEPPNIRSAEAFKHYHELFHGVIGGQDLGNTEYGYLAVNWNFKNSQIIEAMTRWLKQQRAARKAGGLNDAKPIKSRDGFKDKLNRLGALRIKNHYRKKQLVNYGDTNLKFNLPYSHYQDLCDAAKRAGQEIARMFPKKWDESAWWHRANQPPIHKAELPSFPK